MAYRRPNKSNPMPSKSKKLVARTNKKSGRRARKRVAVARGMQPRSFDEGGIVMRQADFYPVYAPPRSVRFEMKHVDVALATYAADTTGSVTFLTPLAPGTTILTREGSRLNLLGTQIRGVCSAGTTGTLAQATCVLVWDRQTNGAAPVITNVYETISSDAWINVDNRQRFTILGRWDFRLIGNSTTPTVGQEEFVVDRVVRYQKPQVWDQSSGSVIASVISGGLFLLTFGDIAAGTAAPKFTVQVRTFFADD